MHQASRSRATRLLLAGAMAVMVGGIIVSFSRSGFVTLVGMMAIWTFQNVRRRGVRALLMLVPVALVVLLMLPAGYTERLATLTDAESDTTGSIGERWETMVLATKMILRSPVVGVGLGNYVHVSVAETRSAVDAHNAYLKLGAELGIPAMIVYILFIASAIATARAVRVFFHRRREGWELGRLAGGVELSLIAFAIGAFFSPVSYHFYLFYPAGLAVALFTIAARVPVPARQTGAAVAARREGAA
jgi:O-antigen ligase